MEEFQNKLYSEISAQHKEIEKLRESYIITNDRYSESLVLLNSLVKNAQDVAKRVKEQFKESVLDAVTARDNAAKTVNIATAEAKERASFRTSTLAYSLEENPEAIGFIIESAAKAAAEAEEAAIKASKIVAAAADKLAEAVALSAALSESVEAAALKDTLKDAG